MSSAPSGTQIGWDCTSVFPIPDGGTITKLRLKSQSCPSSVGNSVKVGRTEIPFPTSSDGRLLSTRSNSSCDARRDRLNGLPSLSQVYRRRVWRIGMGYFGSSRRKNAGWHHRHRGDCIQARAVVQEHRL